MRDLLTGRQRLVRRTKGRARKRWRMALRRRFGNPASPPGEAACEMPLHVRPFGGEDAVHHAVPDCAVSPGLVMADHAVLPCAEPFDGSLGGKVEVVGPKADDLAAQRLEGMCRAGATCRRCSRGCAASCCVPGVADLHPVDWRLRRRDTGCCPRWRRSPARGRPRAACCLRAGPRVRRQCTQRLFRPGYGGEPELPQPAIRGGGGQCHRW